MVFDSFLSSLNFQGQLWNICVDFFVEIFGHAGDLSAQLILSGFAFKLISKKWVDLVHFNREFIFGNKLTKILLNSMLFLEYDFKFLLLNHLRHLLLHLL